MEKSKVIGFDIDGVLYPWHLYVYQDLYNSGEIDYTYDYFWKYISSSYSQERWESILENFNFFRGDFYDGASEMLNEYSNYYDIFYLTSRPEKAYQLTREQLDKYRFPNPDNLIITKNKVDVISDVQPDYFVEDNKKYISDLYDLTQVVAVKHPWNYSFFEKSRCMKILWINHILELPKVVLLKGE